MEKFKTKTLIKLLSIFVFLLLTISAASAACYQGSHYNKYNSHDSRYEHNYNTHSKYSHQSEYRNCDGSCRNCNGCDNCTCNCSDCQNGNCSDCQNGNCSDCQNCSNGSVDDTETSDETENTEVTPVETTGDTGTTSYNPKTGNTYWVGADGERLLLINYNNAVNPSYDQLLVFLKADKTDEHPYTSTYTCGDFAETLHNHAEAAGIRCALVGSNSCNHAFNEFETTDKGIVYIDCTGVPGGSTLQDKELTVGSSLVGKYLFRSGSVNMGCNPGELLVFW